MVLSQRQLASKGSLRVQGIAVRWCFFGCLLAVGGAGGAQGAAVPLSLNPPSLRLHSSTQLGRASYLVAGGNDNKRGDKGDDDGVITIQLNVKPFVNAVKTQLAIIAGAAKSAGSAVTSASSNVAQFSTNAAKSAGTTISRAAGAAGEVGGKAIAGTIDAGGHVAGAVGSAGGRAVAATSKAVGAAGELSGKVLAGTIEVGHEAAHVVAEASSKAAQEAGNAVRQGLAQAQKAAGEIEDLVKANPNEAAAVGVSLAAVLALKAVLSHPKEEEPVIPPSLLNKIKNAASASTSTIGSAVTSVGTASSLKLSVGSAKNATVAYYRGTLVPSTESTLMLFGSFVEATLNVTNKCYVRAYQAMCYAAHTMVEEATALSKYTVHAGANARPHLEAIRVSPVKFDVKSGSVAGGTMVLDMGSNQRVGGLLVSNRPAVLKEGKMLMGGSNDYAVYVKGEEGKWELVHEGWLRPGPGSGASSTSSQYLSFDARWCRYVKFETKTAYKAGAGLSAIQVISALGPTTMWLYCTRPVDVVQSLFDSRFPGMWGEVFVPVEEIQSNMSKVLRSVNAKFAPIMMPLAGTARKATNSTLLVTAKVAKASYAASKAAANASYVASKSAGKAAYKGANATYYVSAKATKVAKKQLGAAGGAAARASKMAANSSYYLTLAASQSAGRGLAKVSYYTVNASKTAGGSIRRMTSKARMFFQKRQNATVVGKHEEGNLCLPLTVLALAGGSVTYRQSEEFRDLVDPILGEVRDKAVEVRDKAVEVGAVIKEKSVEGATIVKDKTVQGATIVKDNAQNTAKFVTSEARGILDEITSRMTEERIVRGQIKRGLF